MYHWAEETGVGRENGEYKSTKVQKYQSTKEWARGMGTGTRRSTRYPVPGMSFKEGPLRIWREIRDEILIGENSDFEPRGFCG
jgi:hypothetical protein